MQIAANYSLQVHKCEVSALTLTCALHRHIFVKNIEETQVFLEVLRHSRQRRQSRRLPRLKDNKWDSLGCIIHAFLKCSSLALEFHNGYYMWSTTTMDNVQVGTLMRNTGHNQGAQHELITDTTNSSSFPGPIHSLCFSMSRSIFSRRFSRRLFSLERLDIVCPATVSVFSAFVYF